MQPPLTLDLTAIAEDEAWLALLPEAEARARDLCEVALGRFLSGEAALSLVLADDAFVRNLNRDYRGRDKPTNILSFPAFGSLEEAEIMARETGEPVELGDLILARQTLVREAEEQGKTLSDHFSHLIVHGALHLLGFDHESDEEAEEMENLEREILQLFHIGDPYAGQRAAHP